MARPIKQGLDYFPFDTDFFSDVKIRKISRACGPNSISILICLLCNIYNDKGYYIVWDEDLPFVVADSVGTTEGAVIEVVKKAVQVDFFDKEMFEKQQILTSRGIQSRFKKVASRREKIEYVDKYLVYDDKNGLIVCKNGVIVDRSTQSKVKERESKVKNKEEKRKENTLIESKTEAAKAAALKRKKEFYESLVPFVQVYGKEMTRKFFDYWSEMNKSGTKMRFELQKTWELSLRLSKWNEKEKVPPRPKSNFANFDNDQHYEEF